MDDEAGQHLARLCPLFIIESPDFAVVEMDLAEYGLWGFNEAETFARSGTHHPVGKL
jgi:hypothetical protein